MNINYYIDGNIPYFEIFKYETNYYCTMEKYDLLVSTENSHYLPNFKEYGIISMDKVRFY